MTTGSDGDHVGWRHLPGWLSPVRQRSLLAEIRAAIAEAPLLRPAMPRSGKAFSVLMTNCGPLGWVSDRDGGYRYQRDAPTNRPTLAANTRLAE